MNSTDTEENLVRNQCETVSVCDPNIKIELTNTWKLLLFRQKNEDLMSKMSNQMNTGQYEDEDE